MADFVVFVCLGSGLVMTRSFLGKLYMASLRRVTYMLKMGKRIKFRDIDGPS